MITGTTLPTRAEAIALGIRELESYNIADSRRNVEWMLCESLLCDRASLYAHPESMLSETEWREFREMLERRARHEPLQYILGYTSFCGLRIDVSPDVLIPRPETEQLFEQARTLVGMREAPRVLDVGTGSGCLAVALGHHLQKSEVFACDVSPDALAVAAANAKRHRVDVSFFRRDILDPSPATPPGAPYDLIVSNPPYIPEHEYVELEPEVRDFEPERALNAGPDPLVFYHALAQKAPAWLKTGGSLLVEVHCDYGDAVAALLRRAGLAGVALKADLAGRPRIVSGRK